MNNKLCVITGANSGIGFETTKALAEKGAYTVMVCRNEDKAEQARQKIIDETGNRGIEIVLCDFAIQSEIRQAAQKITDEYKQIDVLINNHGFLASEKEETVDGLEKTFAVNHIGYFLFTNLLLPQLKKADSARIVSVASDAHQGGTFDPDNLQLHEGYKPFKAYCNSKLFNIMFTTALANRLAETSVTANCLHPGVIASNFAQSGSWFMSTMFKLMGPFLTSPEKGAETSIYLASSPEVEGVNGAYFKDKKAATPSKTARDEEAAELLWDISKKLCGI
ncbi:SDR family oxidoreductase [Gracilimonas mengyeensis]|uniref:NAD(P)-dependent dehydrogenase, short-chain alcohol dehydrogenase family n=1 Tax=Gracilimonas mengyeensis TaxID=1302730 RepID=A0A521BVM1_9BACT|nr:SDR family oxidoreductase [Gracilimonas mengyeensis]SMO51206.1 NAD(P)-dependent dehydrogenase, short-chain alcohol dehydrogenase family [Gracilimonas mengyeensis]